VHQLLGEPRATSRGVGRSFSCTVTLKLWALEQLPIPMSLFDVHGMRIEANAAMALLLDRSGSDVIGLGERREQYRTSPPPRANVRRRWTRPAHRRADRTTLG